MTNQTDGDARTEADLDEQADYYDYDPDYADDYYDDDDYYETPDYDYLDNAPSSDYSAGYADGYNAALAHMRLKYRLQRLIPWKWRFKYYALRRRLFPHNSDIPF